MRRTARSIALCLAVLVGTAVRAEVPDDIEVHAYVSTAGPYGESWQLDLKADGTVSLQILYMLNPMGKMSGDFLVFEEGLASLRKVVAAERFAELPKAFKPGSGVLHKPDLRLSVTVAGRKHEVSVYDPDELTSDPRLTRFMAVWKQVFALIPLSPKW